MCDFPSPLLTPAEAATYLRVSLVTLRRMTTDGRVPVIRLGKTVRIRQSELEALTATRGQPSVPNQSSDGIEA
jgi:excisionase family DNA binding protein